MEQETVDPSTLRWVEAEKGYSLALCGPKAQLVCRNKSGKQLASVPGPVKKGATAQRLLELKEWMAEHDRECSGTVQRWMLGSLPVPRAAIQAAWPDAIWKRYLEYAVVAPTTLDGEPDWDRAGLLRGVDEGKGVGVVNLDGESEWIDTTLVAFPHPILLPELADFRELLAELKVEQGLLQLFRETFPKPADLSAETTSIQTYAGGKFEMIQHAVGRSRSLGYRVRGGYATCSLFEQRTAIEARFWIGTGDSYDEVWTGELGWVDGEESELKLGAVGPVAYSEGVRMASSIYAGRAKDEEGED